jgi:hypothetical protein
VLCRFQAAYSGVRTIDRLNFGKTSVAQTRRPVSRCRSGRRNIAFTTLNISAFAPMPSATVISAAAVNAGFRRRRRTTWRASDAARSIHMVRL